MSKVSNRLELLDVILFCLFLDFRQLHTTVVPYCGLCSPYMLIEKLFGLVEHIVFSWLPLDVVMRRDEHINHGSVRVTLT